jgi:hypothetical protein
LNPELIDIEPPPPPSPEETPDGTMGQTDVTITNTQTAPANFISATGEVRLRVSGSRTSSQSFICRGDYVRFTVETAGSSISRLAGSNELLASAFFTSQRDPEERYIWGIDNRALPSDRNALFSRHSRKR